MTAILKSTGVMSSPSSSCCWTCVSYQSLNLLRINSFADLFTLRSIDCSRFVQFAGTLTTWMLFSSRSLAMCSVCWALKKSKQPMPADWVNDLAPCACTPCIRYDDLLNVLLHFVFIGQVVECAHYKPINWKFVEREIGRSFPLVD